MTRSLHSLLLLTTLVFVCAADDVAARHHSSHAHSARAHATTQAGNYDYYVMALSWSPTFCETHVDEEEQCGHKGYGFVLHGLWPQYENGGGPQRCETEAEPDRKTAAEALAFMPSMRLINHEWHAHGTCTGLDPAAYFSLADRAYAVIAVPPELKAPRAPLQMDAAQLRRVLERANPGLRDDMLSLHCSQGELAEVRVCLDKNLGLRSCGKRMRTGCPVSEPFSIPAVR